MRSKTFCPNCGSDNVMIEAGGIMGSVWKCNECEYNGTFFPEEEKVDKKNLKRFKEIRNAGN